MTAFRDCEIGLPGKQSGKVRDWYTLGDGKRLIVTTDRLSAFDRVLSAVPFKGQVLNQLSAWWFARTADIIGNHLVSVPDPNAIVALEVEPLSVEVVVRGFITGVTTTALWYRYSLGERSIYGYDFPEGLHKNEALPRAIITPTTKGGPTGHDERLAAGLEPASFDKEFVRLAYARLGYRGDGPMPAVPDSLWEETSLLYRSAYEQLTGTAFEPGDYPVGPRLERNLRAAGLLR